MSRPVKRRTYRSEHRRGLAEQTRTRVLDAAAEVFRGRGYGGASISAIAEAAGVSPETIYVRFGNKRTLLGELVQRAVRGDDPAPVLEQPAFKAVAAATDQREQLRLFAADIVLRLERAAPLLAVVSEAARSEPELAVLLERMHGGRLENFHALVKVLARNGPLQVSKAEAAETIWALTSPELHQALTGVRGWTRERYAKWLARSLAGLLLRD
ncbi:MAG TPA: TetR/AcrR family transcriptional regulator [Gaiellaceae bacterium]|nr:TetR/AcrR family transcriptional regulator [Gaiellaceae bacterium]